MVDPQVMMPKEEEVEDCLDMPPGFRFHPTDLEIIIHYLEEKTMNGGFSARAIGEIDLNGCEPWDLPSRAKMGEKEWYFFWQRDRKYPTGTRTNRATESGYWKATGKDKEICKGKGCLVGMKKTLVFYLGRAPKGEKTNWVMHEYRLEGSRPLHNDLLRTAKNDWVVCRVFHKNVPAKVSPPTSDSYFREGLLDSPNLPPLLDSPQYPNASRPGHCTTFNDDGNNGVGGEGALSSMPPFSYNRAMTMAMDLPENFSVARLLTPYPAAPSASAFNPQVPPQLLPRMSYLHYNQAGATNPLRGECKAEEYTGNRGATDWTTSAGGGDDCRNYDDPGSPSAGPLLDLEKYMWS